MSAEVIALLRQAIRQLEASTALPGRPSQVSPNHAAAGSATDAELSAKYGDPEIRRDPKFWEGESCIGKRMSQCPVAYLDALAKYKDASAKANETEGDPARAKYIAYDRKDARLARGWARRLRAASQTPSDFEVDPELGF